jgi:2-octaprenyl-6-methoxyphenol hydroxylase
MWAPVTLTGVERGPHGIEARFSDGRTVRAAAVAACDGRASRLRREAGIRTLGWTYAQSGIVCTVAHARSHGGVAIERFLPAGPFAMLPLTGRRCSLVWTERTNLAKAIMELDADDFEDEMRRRFGDFLGAARVTGPRWSYPLSLHLAERYVDHRMALVGDAAHGVHPIAGQGLNMGMRDAAAVAEALVDSRRLGLDIGDSWTLQRYQRWRRLDNLSLLAVTDALTRLFSNNNPGLRLARNLGLAAVNRLPPLKRMFMRHARGTMGELPRLLQGAPL